MQVRCFQFSSFPCPQRWFMTFPGTGLWLVMLDRVFPPKIGQAMAHRTYETTARLLAQNQIAILQEELRHLFQLKWSCSSYRVKLNSTGSSCFVQTGANGAITCMNWDYNHELRTCPSFACTKHQAWLLVLNMVWSCLIILYFSSNLGWSYIKFDNNIFELAKQTPTSSSGGNSLLRRYWICCFCVNQHAAICDHAPELDSTGEPWAG